MRIDEAWRDFFDEEEGFPPVPPHIADGRHHGPHHEEGHLGPGHRLHPHHHPPGPEGEREIVQLALSGLGLTPVDTLAKIFPEATELQARTLLRCALTGPADQCIRWLVLVKFALRDRPALPAAELD